MCINKSKCTPARVKNCLRTFLVHLFSHVGLCILVVGYAVVGGLVFQKFEADLELQTIKNLTEKEKDWEKDFNKSRKESVIKLWGITDRLNVLYEYNWTQEVEAELDRFSKDVINKHVKPPNLDTKWSFTQALLYAVSIITTIGYGNLAPKTMGGKLFTMFYALVGVPLMLLWVSNIGNVMANTFKFAYFHAPCCSGKKLQRNSTSKPVQQSSTKRNKEKSGTGSSSKSSPSPCSSKSGDVGCAVATSVQYSMGEDKYETRVLEAGSPPRLKPSLSSRSRRSLKDLDPGAQQVLLECAEYNLSVNSCGDERSRRVVQQLGSQMPIDEDDEGLSEAESVVEVSVVGPRCCYSTPPPPLLDDDHLSEPAYFKGARKIPVIETLQVPDAHGTPSRVPLLDPEAGSDENKEGYGGGDQERVPISLVLFVVVLYILLGATVFTYTEKGSWTFFDSAYFCFITLSTIGLGDMTPQSSIEHSGTTEATAQLVFCCFYLVVGLAIIAMSFNLVQEQVTIKAKEFARRIGIIEDNYV